MTQRKPKTYHINYISFSHVLCVIAGYVKKTIYQLLTINTANFNRVHI